MKIIKTGTNFHFSTRVRGLLLFLLFTLFSNAQTISKYLIGNNAWYETSVSGLFGRMAEAKFQTIRVGGNGAENYLPTNALFQSLTSGIRNSGIEPIVQIPKTYTDDNVRSLVTFLNGTNRLNVRIWGIGNEPDHTNKPATAEEVSAYIKRISTVLKSIDPTFIVMGPSTAAFSATSYMNRLVGGDLDITGKNANGDYYIDVYTWHRYMFVDIDGLESDVNTFLTRVTAANAKRPADKQLKWGMTEFNTSWNNDNNTSADQNVWSFRAGQTFAEVYGLGMRKGAFTLNAWSMYEGQVERQGTDLSLFDKDAAKSGRSNYYHSLMLGQNMKDNYISPTDNQANVTVIPMKDATGTAVMILNKDKTNGFDYSLRLNTATVTTSNRLNINVPAGLDKEVYGYISQASTQMLVFDAAGNLTKRYIYTALDAAARRAPVVQTTFCNMPPSATLVTQQTVCVDEAEFYVNLTGISDGDKNTQGLEVIATSQNSNVVTVKSVTYNPVTKNAFILLQPKVLGVATISIKIKELTNSCSPDSVLTSFNVVTYPTIPAKVEAEYYTDVFRVQNQSTTDSGGGLNMSNIEADDWLDYTVRVPRATTYDVSFRLASFPSTGTGAFKLMNGSVSLATVNVQKTTGWQDWRTQTVRVSLPAGDQKLRIAVTSTGFNLNWINFVDPQTAITETKSETYSIGIRDVGNAVVFDVNEISPTGSDSVLRIFSTSGQTIAIQTISDAEKSVVFNKSHLKPGVYIVNYQTNNRTYNQKFILK